MKNNFFKYIFFIFAIGIIVFAVYKINNKEEKISSKETETESQSQEVIKELKLGIAEFDTINPILSNNKYVQDASKLIFNSLLTIDKDYKIKPDLATEWAKISGTEYLIKLRQNVKWSDGSNFSAYDVLYTIDRLKESNSIYLNNVRCVSEVWIVDDNTVKIKLSEEVPFFEYNLIFPIMSKNYYGEDNFFETEKNNQPIGTNMYKISEIQDGKIILNKNENYYNKNEKAIIDKITISKFSNVGELYNAFKLGQIDIVSTTNTNIEEYIGSIGYGKKEHKGRQHFFLAINMENEILSRIEVRQAIKYSINKDEIISNLFNGKYYKSSFPLDYGNWLNEGNEQDEYNLDKANQVLIDNGWEYKYNYWRKIEDYRTLKLDFKLVVKNSDYKKVEIAENLKNQLENLGIKISLIKANDYQYSSYLENKNYDIILCSIDESLNPNLSTFLGEYNLANYINVDSINVINELKNITDEKLLKEKYLSLEKIYKEEIPYISLFSNYSILAYNSKLVGNITPNWYNIFYNINSWHK